MTLFHPVLGAQVTLRYLIGHTVALAPILLFHASYDTVLLPSNAAGVHVRISLALPAAIGRHPVPENSAGGGGSAGG